MVERTGKLSYERLMAQHLKILGNLQYKSGLFAASKKNSKTGYNKSWLRDNFYECLAFEVVDEWNVVKKTYRALLDIFLKHEYKIDYAILRKPKHRHEYIHARFHPDTFDEFWEEWGNKQNDSIGAILYKIGELEHHKDVRILESKDDVRIVNKLVKYLASIQYWHDEDSGMWEEDEEIHASSVGACVAGLRNVSNIPKIEVPSGLIDKGKKTLKMLLPRESKKKFIDLALLSLIWPYNVVTKSQRDEILKNAEYHLVRRKGLIRYKNDYYYNKNVDGYSEEAEWTFGFSWLAIIYDKIGDKVKAKKYMDLAVRTINKNGRIPELYYSNSDKYNSNTPLGWSESLFVIALYDINKKHSKR